MILVFDRLLPKQTVVWAALYRTQVDMKYDRPWAHLWRRFSPDVYRELEAESQKLVDTADAPPQYFPGMFEGRTKSGDVKREKVRSVKKENRRMRVGNFDGVSAAFAELHRQRREAR